MGGHGFDFLGLPASCPRVHAKMMRAARQMQSEQVSISGRIKGVYRHQLGASHRFHVQNVLRARPQRRSKRGRLQQAGSGLSKLAGELLHQLRAHPLSPPLLALLSLGHLSECIPGGR